MRTIFITFYCAILHLVVLGADPKYPASTIPADLKANVNAVVREDKMVYKIFSRSKASLYSHYVITILNEHGNEHADLTLHYNKLTKITDMNGTVYDASGKVIKKLKNNQILDRSAVDGYTLFSDERIKYADLSQSTYPYTVEFEYETEYRYMFGIEGTVILHDEKISLEHLSYQVIYPANLKPHFKLVNIENDKPAETKTADGLESSEWVFQNVKAIKSEPMGPDLTPQIMAAPREFEFEGYVGNMSSWEEFGKWILLLNNGRGELPEAAKQKVKELTKGFSTVEEKTKALYNYLQSRTRYVSIQLGIGGYQPFEASLVDQVGYGDCKALSNYMVAMLKESGIKAFYTVIHGGRSSGMMLDFTSSQFNHAIVAVPNGADTIWLECTSQTNPFGYQGRFTGDRKAMLITESGGKIVNTTRYKADQNKQLCSSDVFVDKTGNAKAKIKTIYTGLQYENGGLEGALNSGYDDQKKWLQNDIGIPSFDLTSFSMTDNKDRLPSAVIALDLTLNRFATASGKRLFLTPNLMNRSTFLPEKVENRKTKVVLSGITYTDIDTIRYHVPEEIYPEFLPEPIKFKSRFGEYEASFKLDAGMVIYTRKVIMKNGVFPAESYNELIDFYKSMNKADNLKLVFLNKT